MSGNNIDKALGELSLEDAPVKWVLKLGDISDEGRRGEKCADRDEVLLVTKMLADEHDLEVKSLCCTFEVLPRKMADEKGNKSPQREDYTGHFTVRAELRQICVVTLERIDTVVLEEFSQDFSSSRVKPSKSEAGEIELDDPFAADPPIRIFKSQINLGPLVYQYFSMAVDPNPRKNGVLFEDEAAGDEGAGDKPVSPFVVLEKYRSKK